MTLILVLLLIVLAVFLSVLVTYLFFAGRTRKVEVHFVGGADSDSGRIVNSGTLFKGVPSQYNETVDRDDSRGVLMLRITELGSGRTENIPLYDAIAIGRERQQNAFVVTDTSVSKRHCRVYLSGGEVWLTDLNSFNHTYLNGSLVSGSVRLSGGSIIKMGNTELRIDYQRR